MKRMMPVLAGLLLVIFSFGPSSAQDATRYYDQGKSYFNQGKYSEAISALTRAIDLNPKHAEAYNYRGLPKEAEG